MYCCRVCWCAIKLDVWEHSSTNIAKGQRNAILCVVANDWINGVSVDACVVIQRMEMGTGEGGGSCRRGAFAEANCQSVW